MILFVLAGCAVQSAPPDPQAISPPLASLMVPPEDQLPIPAHACEADPLCRAETYYAPHRAQCGGYRDGQIGLQAYIKALHAKHGSR